MNSSTPEDGLRDVFTKHFISVSLGCFINVVNGALVYIYFKNQVFQRDPRYVLYIHLVITDMILLTLSVALQIITYNTLMRFTPCCILLFILIPTSKISPLNLAAMAVERYIAVCRPLHHAQICTVQRAYALIALIWGVSVIPFLIDIIIIILATQPPFFSGSVICYPSGVFSTPYHRAHSVTIQVLRFSFVFLTLIITYLKVLCAAQAASGSNQASARNARNTILLHGVQLLICMLSYIAPFINLILITMSPRNRTMIRFSSFLITGVFPRLLSPLIYGVRDKKFSSHIRLHFCSKCQNSVEKRVKRTGPRRRSKRVFH